MANNFYGAIGLIGGGAGALDSIDGAGLADLDAAFVQILGTVYFYTLDDDSGAAEDSPNVISPDTNAGTKRWILQGFEAPSLLSPSGSFKMGGVSGTNNENLIWDFETTANAALLSSTTDLNLVDFQSISISMDDGSTMGFGSSQDARMSYDGSGAIDSFVLGLVVGSNNSSGVYAIMERGEVGHANRRPAAYVDRPTVRIYAEGNVSATDYLEFSNTITQGIINQADGDLAIHTAGVQNLRFLNTGGVVQAIFPLVNDPTKPTLAFGDGNTGLYEEADNVMAFASSGSKQSAVLNGWAIRAAASNGGGIKNETATATNPSYVASYGDVDSGMGWAGADILTLIAGGVEGLRVVEDTTIQVILPLQNDAAKPSLAFGDGDTGFYESADDIITIAVVGGARFIINSTNGGQIRGSGSTAAILNESPTATNPSLVPNVDDIDTGVGASGADALSLVAGAVEGLRVTEAASVITNRLSDNVALSNTAEGNTGNIAERTTREVHTLTLGASSVTTTITIPTGAMLLGVSFNVNDTVVDDAGDDTWSAAFSGGSTATLATAAAAAIDTKVNTLIVPEIASGATEVTFTPNGGSFSAGIIEVVAYYKSLTSLGDV